MRMRADRHTRGMAGGVRDRRAGAGDRIDRLLARTDVFNDVYRVAPPWLAEGAVLPRHANSVYELWRRGRHVYGTRVNEPYYPVPMPPDLLTARERINTRVREHAAVYGTRTTRELGANRRPLRADMLRTGFAAADVEFFGEPAIVDVRVLRDGRRIGRLVNAQAITPPMPPLHAGIVAEDRARRSRHINVTVRSLHRSLNRVMANYVGADDDVHLGRWEGVESPNQARAMWPSLSQRAFWSAAAWRRALRLTSAAGEWTLQWERLQNVVLHEAVVAQH